MISAVDILRAAHLMMHRYGGDAEPGAAKYVDLMRGCGDRDGLLAWARIWRLIAPIGLPQLNSLRRSLRECVMRSTI
jgi:hypothetical protein